MTDYLSDEVYLPQYAKKRLRVGAIVIDYIILFAANGILDWSFGQSYTTNDGVFHFYTEGYSVLANLGIWFALFPLIEGLTGQTLGKKIVGIKVIKEDFSSTTFGNSLVRHLFDFVDYLPFLGILGLIVSSSNLKSQRVGDLVAKTIVVYKDDRQQSL